MSHKFINVFHTDMVSVLLAEYPVDKHKILKLLFFSLFSLFFSFLIQVYISFPTSRYSKTKNNGSMSFKFQILLEALFCQRKRVYGMRLVKQVPLHLLALYLLLKYGSWVWKAISALVSCFKKKLNRIVPVGHLASKWITSYYSTYHRTFVLSLPT